MIMLSEISKYQISRWLCYLKYQNIKLVDDYVIWNIKKYQISRWLCYLKYQNIKLVDDYVIWNIIIISKISLSDYIIWNIKNIILVDYVIWNIKNDDYVIWNIKKYQISRWLCYLKYQNIILVCYLIIKIIWNIKKYHIRNIMYLIIIKNYLKYQKISN